MLTRMMGDRGLAKKVIAEFLQDIPAKLSNLNQLVGTGDVPGIRLQAHSLKGAAATLSARALRDVACELQQTAIAHDLKASLALLPRLEERFEQLKTTLKQSGWA
jgi:HPt (histidine-containing phosphotransfer) domain-containing protein